MTNAITIREATSEDASSISRLGSRAFRETNQPIIGPAATDAVIAQTYSVPALQACIQACARAADAFFLVALRDARLVGYLHYDTADAEPELHRIYVHPDHKGQGIGTALLNGLHSRLPPNSRYRLIVAAANTDALRFYRRHGFTEQARIDHAHFPGITLSPDADTVPVIILQHTR